LFGLSKVPSDNHIRDMLDPAPPALLQGVFDKAIEELGRVPGGLDVFRRLGGHTLIALDGTQHYCSQKIGATRIEGPAGQTRIDIRTPAASRTPSISAPAVIWPSIRPNIVLATVRAPTIVLIPRSIFLC
jgi:hypothetical protein